MRVLFTAAVVCVLASSVEAALVVRDADAFRKAVASARPGERVLLAQGTYKGVFYFSGLKGAPGHPIVIGAADPYRPPVIKGATEGIHLTSVNYVELRDLVVEGASVNGINIDDGGDYSKRSRYVVLRNVRVIGTGPTGGGNGIKLSGVDDFTLLNCTVERWPGSGCAVDMVGCHGGTIQGCEFRNGGMVGIQVKGGSERIVVRGCRFDGIAERGVNVGGSTGMQFFRPKPQGFEARDIRVEGCVFTNCKTPVAFVGADRCVFRYNTVYRPGKWALRILQETVRPDFVPCRNGAYIANIVVFRSDEMTTAVNVGPNTAPSTFRFEQNLWYCMDAPARSKPSLPAPESGGVYGKDPLFRDPARGDFGVRPGSPAVSIGAHAVPDR
ncbi:MAG: right-handed parallel beta-helix repeat-containing protein [Armatimonadota bacterium]